MEKTLRGLNSKMKLLHPMKGFFLRPFPVTEAGAALAATERV